MFARVLDYRLYGILKEHSVDKPVLVFCPTRKGSHPHSTLCMIPRLTLTLLGVFATAEQLVKGADDLGPEERHGKVFKVPEL